MTASDLKTKAVLAAMAQDEQLYADTGNAHHAWHAWQLARRMKVDVPEWVLTFVDGIAARDVAVRSRAANTADRYQLALTHMDAAVERHRTRLKRRAVGRRLGREIPISRRDRPNLTAIAQEAAKVYRVSTNRLLTRYRALLKRSS